MATLVNPFLQPSELPYQLPPFDEIRFEHYEPAFEQGMAEHKAEVNAIIANSDEPSFDNTIVALERAGQLLTRVAEVFFNKSSSDGDDALRELEERLAPELSAHEDAIHLNSELYARIHSLFERRDQLELDDEQRYLLERHHTVFTLAGAGLDDDEKRSLSQLNAQLAVLATRFEKNLLNDTNALAVVVDDGAELEGLDDDEIAACAEAARERGLDSSYVISLVLPTGHPYLASLRNRSLRERLMTASRSRALRGNENDNRSLVTEITRLRARRAELLGFANHAALVTADETAGSPSAVANLLERLAPIAARNAHREQAVLEQHAGHPIEAWDWAFYTERVRASEHEVDTAALRPYFEAERVLHNGLFFAANRLYGLTFSERDDLSAYHPDARVFEVHDSDGEGLGLYILDLYARESKRGGAWMNPLVSQSSLLGSAAVVVNNLNVPQPPRGEPTLLSYDEVETFFHEFGHALHGLLAHVTYPTFSGTNVFRDFVEFPSQVNEMWMLWPEVLNNYAVHHLTGEPLAAEVGERLRASTAFNEGFATSEYLAAALLDQAWHTLTPDREIADVEEFERAALSAVGLDNAAVPPRYSSTYFAHTFSGGYDAGYYSYIWSEVLDADTVAWFRENGGLTRENGDRFRRLVLGVGGSRDPLDAYREFRGADADIRHLIERRGLDA